MNIFLKFDKLHVLQSHLIKSHLKGFKGTIFIFGWTIPLSYVEQDFGKRFYCIMMQMVWASFASLFICITNSWVKFYSSESPGYWCNPQSLEKGMSDWSHGSHLGVNQAIPIHLQVLTKRGNGHWPVWFACWFTPT